MITTETQLRQLYAMPGERAVLKQRSDLDAHCLRFIALSPFCVVATGGAAGRLMDASPRGGAPGFVHAPDAQTLWIPDAGGNNRLDSLCNLLHDPRIGLLFMVPGIQETLRVNGLAKLRDESHCKARFAAPNFQPKLVIEVQVQEAYLHCAKALMRSKLWHAQAQVERTALPSMNQMVHAQIGLTPPTETQEQMEQRYRVQITSEQLGDGADR